jgi:peptidoglycan/LPS O-acetylase OafA/YrhL
MSVAEAQANRLQNVEIMRGLSALSVAWFHFTNGNPSFISSGLLHASGQYGYLGVEVFFVISGFVIPYSLYRRSYQFPRDAGNFALRRLIRLEPAYLMSLVLVIILLFGSALLSSNVRILSDLPSTVGLHVAYLTSWFGAAWLNPVYWSLAIEFQYYAFILVAAPLLLSADQWRVRLFLCLASILPWLAPDTRLFTHYLPLFGLGFIRFLVGPDGPKHIPLWECSIWTLLFASIAAVTLGTIEAGAGVLALAALFVFVGHPPKWLAGLGVISYSLYLVHVPIGGRIINLASRLPHNRAVELAAVLLALAVSLAAAWVFWRIVEKPTAAAAASVGLDRRRS